MATAPAQNGDDIAQLSARTRRVTLDSPATNTRSAKRKSAESAADLLSDSLDSNSSTCSINSKRRRRDQLQVRSAGVGCVVITGPSRSEVSVTIQSLKTVLEF